MTSMHCLFLISVMLPEKVLIFNYYSSSPSYAFLSYVMGRARKRECALYLERPQGKWEVICCAFLLEFILLLWKVNLPPTGFYWGMLHCTTEMKSLMMLFTMESHLHPHPFAGLQHYLKAIFARFPRYGIWSGISGIVSSRNHILLFQV